MLISNSGLGRELLAQVGAVVEITGELTELRDESRYSYSIKVSDYTILEPAEPRGDREWDSGDKPMNTKHVVVRAAIWLAVFVVPLTLRAASMPEDLAAAKKLEQETHLALDTAHEALSAIQAALDKNNKSLSEAYYVLDDEVRRRDKVGETESRATIRTMNATKERLTTERDQAKSFVAQREAEHGSALALIRVHELRLVANADPAEISRWQKMHEKAVAKASRLERQRAELLPVPDQENTPGE